MTDSLIQNKKLNWAGEHWVNYIRPTGESFNSAMVSLYHTRWSPAGSGSVAFVDIPGDDGYKALCTDNPDLADYAVNTIVKGSTHPPYGQDLPLVEGTFAQSGDIRKNPSWTIETDDHVIVATWTKILPVIIANGSWPDPPTISYVFSLLHFAEAASITLDGRTVRGEPYLRKIWRPTIGGDRSSCVFALSETFMGENEYLATLTCPECGFQEDLEMPTDYCQFFHECSNCKVVMRPKAGDDCVFCSYSDKLCPPKLLEDAASQ